MSRHWLRVNDSNEANGGDEVNERYALENISSFDAGSQPGDTALQQHRQQLSFSRSQSVQRANAHKPVFVVYEDPVDGDVDPFDSNIGWKTLDTVQNQNKENDIAPRAWNADTSANRSISGTDTRGRTASASSSFEVFVDDDCATHPTPSGESHRMLTNRPSTLRQRIDGVATEEEQLAQKPLKNFSGNGSSKSGRASGSSQLSKSSKSAVNERIAYDVEQLKVAGGDLLSFEEARARQYELNRKRDRRSAAPKPSKIPSLILPGGTTRESNSTETTQRSFLASNSFTAPRAQVPRKSATVSLTDSKIPGVVGRIPTTQLAALDAAAQEDMTINTRVAMEDINGMFCSPPRLPKPKVWDVREEDPVERKLHFSVFDDSVDSVALNAQDQSLHQDQGEVAPQPGFQIFADDSSDGLESEAKKPNQRKPLQSRDDLVRGVRLTNRDVLLQMQAKGGAHSDQPDSSAKDGR